VEGLAGAGKNNQKDKKTATSPTTELHETGTGFADANPLAYAPRHERLARAIVRTLKQKPR
jgi:hypothetical protein